VVDVTADGREQEIEMSLTNRARHLCKHNVVAELVKTHYPPHMCYHVEFGRSAIKGAGINTVPLNRGEPPKIGNRCTPLSYSGRSD